MYGRCVWFVKLPSTNYQYIFTPNTRNTNNYPQLILKPFLRNLMTIKYDMGLSNKIESYFLGTWPVRSPSLTTTTECLMCSYLKISQIGLDNFQEVIRQTVEFKSTKLNSRFENMKKWVAIYTWKLTYVATIFADEFFRVLM